jgi:type I restriction enzyme S subunit
MNVFRHMQGEWARLMAGSTHKTIYMPVFRDLRILLPPLEEQELIAQAAAAVDARVVAESAAVQNARSVKKALMSVLLTGELRVSPDEAAT